MSFSHERLDVYRCATAHLALALRLIAGFPRGHAYLADQLRRAALSIPLNIAEGVGRPSPDDRRRHLAIARGSAMECAAVFDAGRMLGLLSEEAAGEAKALPERIVQMLTKMGAGQRG
ncbi:MAG: four helix bundle protein [Deltaproteobacteria bacterium]|nr:four helix bundle protein [Deltaproteobacteria bacterium]